MRVTLQRHVLDERHGRHVEDDAAQLWIGETEGDLGPGFLGRVAVLEEDGRRFDEIADELTGAKVDSA